MRMRDSQQKSTTHDAGLTRRGWLAGFLAVAGLGVQGTVLTPAEAATDLPVLFMNRLKGPLVHAARTASSKQFHTLILGHADISGIALYSLGSYRNGLERSSRSRYYRGVARYMSRYFALQSEEYRVTGAEVVGSSWKDGDSYYVDSKVALEGGSSYSVRWQLKPVGNSFKVVNVRVLGFWLAYFQRQQFEGFIKKRGGSVNALVAALSP